VLTAKGVIEDFAQDLSWDMKNTMVATQAPIQGAILATKITKAAWHTKPSWFVIADNDRMISPELERATAKRMNAKTLSLPTSHVAMLAKPKEVAEFIVDAVASVGSAPLARAC
jgi:pimeloyl-ACP methyl ester carboxylesterase